ncbi:hypothetical protein CF319_g4513 [Tilletia indica]|nr:hypothetical protein CF319_g4513 [Tilletia indica]
MPGSSGGHINTGSEASARGEPMGNRAGFTPDGDTAMRLSEEDEGSSDEDDDWEGEEDEEGGEDEESEDDSDYAAAYRYYDGAEEEEEVVRPQGTAAEGDDDDESGENVDESRAARVALVRDMARELADIQKEARSAPKPNKRKQFKIKLNSTVLLAIDLLRFDMEAGIKNICEQYEVEPNLVRRRLGFCFEVGRKRSNWVRFSKWSRVHDRSVAAATLKARNEKVAIKWAELKAKPALMTKTINRIDRWERQELALVDERTAQKSITRFASQASKFTRAAELNDGIAAVVFAAHPHSMARTVAAGSQHSLTLFEKATRNVEHLNQLRQNFRSLVYASPPESTIPPLKAVKRAEVNYEAMKYPHFKREISPAMIRWIDAGFRKHGKDARRAGWLSQSAKAKKSMTYTGVFDILAKAKLCVEGWPIDCRSYLSEDAEFSEVPSSSEGGPTTLRIVAGSLNNCNIWDKKTAPKFWAALNRKTLRIVPSPTPTQSS